jgi:hypothetical protein
MNGFFRGVGMGVVAGAVLTMAVVPVDKRRMMKSPVGRTMKTVCNMYDSMRDGF